MMVTLLASAAVPLPSAATIVTTWSWQSTPWFMQAFGLARGRSPSKVCADVKRNAPDASAATLMRTVAPSVALPKPVTVSVTL
jgi:hypothetical protein